MAQVKITVLRAFRFTTPADREHGRPLPVEHVFAVGEHLIDEYVAQHPWMAAPNYADGAIEAPDARAARLKALKVKQQQEAAEAVNAKAQADAAMARLARSEANAVKVSQFSDEELNTPIGVLRARQTANVSG